MLALSGLMSRAKNALRLRSVVVIRPYAGFFKFNQFHKSEQPKKKTDKVKHKNLAQDELMKVQAQQNIAFGQPRQNFANKQPQQNFIQKKSQASSTIEPASETETNQARKVWNEIPSAAKNYQQRKPTIRDKRAQHNFLSKQSKPSTDALDEFNATLPKLKAMPKPIIPNQKAQWQAKVTPTIQRRIVEAANNCNALHHDYKPSQAAADHHIVMSPPSPQPQFQTHFNSSSPTRSQQNTSSPPRDEPKGAATDAERKNWMQKIQHSQQKKQNEWLQQMQSEQAAALEAHQKSAQFQITQQPVAAAASMPMQRRITGTSPVGLPNAESAPKTSEPKLPDPKSPERLAYLEAVKELNRTQKLEAAATKRCVPNPLAKAAKKEVNPNIEQTLACLDKLDISLTELEHIPVIQVAGSKGRGATCIIVESILRAHGIKTGVLSSPHLFMTSERIRIDGEPLSEEQFAELFWQVHNKLSEGDGIKPPPSYNKLLTVMAFLAFKKYQVNVAIVEVGGACASDCTNVARHARTIGISTLGWEQTLNQNMSMRDIAWNKAGIMKPEASVFTNVTQSECLEVLAQKAQHLGVKLHAVPNLMDYKSANMQNKNMLSKANHLLRLNGSLAIQLAYDYLRRHKPEYVVGYEPNSTQLTQGTARVIDTLHLPGQFDFMKFDMFNVYLDSADSLESMMACREWFHGRTRSNRMPKILLFDKVNEVNAKDLLTIVRFNMRFDEACFVPNPNFFEGDYIEEPNSKSRVWHRMEELQRAKRNASNWRALCEESGSKDNAQLCLTIASFFEYLSNKYGQSYGRRNELDILVTGSRQLVAATITELQQKRQRVR